jgi:hypothetical protein
MVESKTKITFKKIIFVICSGNSRFWGVFFVKHSKRILGVKVAMPDIKLFPVHALHAFLTFDSI